ncbi:hypothetical protein BC830DRAFT_1130470 [Chytriomyces sp. MP71]|nr:hypothetical protein BC830DRAFT_1130470 [Chytriomyces sp. MP71]
MFAQQDNQEDDNDEVDNIGDQEDGIGEEEEEEEEGEEEEEADENELEEQANSKGTDQEHQEDDGTAGENASQLFHPSSASTATSILTVEGSAVLVQNSGISTVASATAADGQESSKENHQADASADFQPPNTPPDSKPVNGSPNEPKHLERALDEKERIRRLAYKALQEIEADFAKFKNKFYLEESFKIDMEIKTVRDGTHARIASETVAIESRKHAFDTFSSERLRMLLVRYEGECAAAVEIANVEFVRKKAETRSHLMEEAVRNCSLLTEEMRRYHMPHRDRGVSHKRRKTRRHDYAEWKCIMEDDLLDDALPSGPASSFSLHSAPTSGHYNHHSHHSYHHHPAHALAPHAATVKRKPQMTAASVYGYFPSAHVNGLSAQRVEEDLVFLGIK